jgi:hypothetical protein
MKFALFLLLIVSIDASKIIDVLSQPRGTEADPALKVCYNFIPFWPNFDWCRRESAVKAVEKA